MLTICQNRFLRCGVEFTSLSPQEADMAGKYELKQTEGGQFVFNLRAANSKVILTSETYADKAGAQAGIKSVKKNAAKAKNFERKVSENKQHFFVLKATNGEVIGRSELYANASAAAKGIASVQANAGASVSDSTQ